MSEYEPQTTDEVDHLLRNAQLRDELEPYFDEAIGRVNVHVFSTPKENEFLAAMLAWERAPVLPIAEWFDPPLELPAPDEIPLDEAGELFLSEQLWDVIHKLFEKRIVLAFADHLSDRELYCLIYRDILPSQEKLIDAAGAYLHWDCSDATGDTELWLRYYASDRERQNWADEFGETLPAREDPPYPRRVPRRPL
ncbi:MAG: hypothetical protein DWQ31_15395 [Planctomycetota bacterium]|nr:MAG: hypothetical protein DWQ31_15395 [Planctomycetota bacterium]REJ87437.1 MAG: hypothetical protein DWQ35_21510 [Planctomycetota bacterium]REK30771.1 MAG: hypothetical protein DWQ42_01410 [Planctomycetota bacterium]REK42151.1 MAG: hypothetical protein DWQ46_14290 [Planctomycetota bacterium]